MFKEVKMSELIFDVKHPAVNKKSFWSAYLSDGNTVYEDCRAGMRSAWSRLRNFLKSNTKIKILELSLTHGGRQVKISRNHPQDFDGYFLSNYVVAVLGGPQLLGRTVGLVRGPKAYVVSVMENGKKDEKIIDYKDDDPRVILDV
jgi:hypothetical protein